MIAHNDVEQGTDEWHELRWGKIGGTLSKGLFVNSDTLLIDVLSQRLEEFEIEDTFKSKSMERGNDLEPIARDYLELFFEIDFNVPAWLQSEQNELLGISPDGLTECETIACEIKCLERKKHTEVLLRQEIPSEHIHQLVHYFTVNPKLETLYFFCYRKESTKHFLRVLTRESVVNLGTSAKPINKPIGEWSNIANAEANILLEKIKEKEVILKSI